MDRTNRLAIFAVVLACAGWAFPASADYSLSRGTPADGLLMTDGVKPGKYYVRLEGFSGDDSKTRAVVWHDGNRVDFVRGGPWLDGKMTLESRPVEVKPSEAFRIDKATPGTGIVLAEQPLASAPQRVYTDMAYADGRYFEADAVLDATNVAVTVPGSSPLAVTESVDATV